MKIYLWVTNEYNAVVFNRKDEWIVIHADSRGEVDGIDIYGENAVEELKEYYENNVIHNSCWISSEVFSAADLKFDLNYNDDTELIFITDEPGRLFY